MNVQTPAIFVSQEEAVARIARVMDAWPDLSLNGFDYIGGMPRADFDADRDLMLDDWRIVQFQRATLYLSTRCRHGTRIRTRSDSNAFKLRAERALGEMGIENKYIANGVFIAAAISLGYRVRQISYSPNAWINIVVLNVNARALGRVGYPLSGCDEAEGE